MRMIISVTNVNSFAHQYLDVYFNLCKVDAVPFSFGAHADLQMSGFDRLLNKLYNDQCGALLLVCASNTHFHETHNETVMFTLHIANRK